MRQLIPIPAISRSVSSSPPVSVDWKGLEPDAAIGDLNEQYLDEFQEINSVASLAYIVCCAEWLYFFLRHHFKPAESSNFDQFIIANWVWLCELPRKLAPYYDLGVVEVIDRRPENAVAVEYAISTIWDGVMCIPNEETFIQAGLATQICEFVLPPDSEFSTWRKDILLRLKKEFPAGGRPNDQVQVSRNLFDLDSELKDVDHKADCSTLVGDADLKGNRYLPLTAPDPD